MEKLGNTEYEWENLEIQMDENIFIPMKMLNEARREALESLENELSLKSTFVTVSSDFVLSHGCNRKPPIRIATIKAIPKAVNFLLDFVILITSSSELYLNYPNVTFF